jgi:oxalate decarboxylase
MKEREQTMSKLSRRWILAAGATGGVAMSMAAAQPPGVFGNPDLPPQGAANATAPAFSDPGPQNPALANNEQPFLDPPATDVGSIQQFWSSFNIAPKRVQAGGWARQVTTAMFPISTEIAGVNMRLDAGGTRELHWHQQAEWAVMTYGNCRVTALDAQRRPYVADVKAGDLWYFPAGLPHSLQGLGPDGCEFVICFDNGAASEDNTLLLSDWISHTPPKVLAKNFGVSADAFKNIPLQQRWIFQGEVPGSLAVDQQAVASTAGAPPYPFVYRLSDMKPNEANAGGSIHIADTSNFHASLTVASVMMTIKPGCMREMHWHPNADEWQYYIQGKARMTVFNTGPNATTAEFMPGDIGYVPKSLGHYVENIGDNDVILMSVFRTSHYEEVSLSDWLAHTPPAMVAQTLNLHPAAIAKFPKNSPGIVPA